MRCSAGGRTSLWALVLNLFDQSALSESTFTPAFDTVFIQTARQLPEPEQVLLDTEGEIETNLKLHR